ncbi:class I SAM-dependent methyltransferase [Oligoflexus tunisiensis]|uniref:class I SAM-dependent methyltransferase n=1 Tax=Oligoflexus tunisiensis TaxID=708132 RepID=UPI000A7FE018|nr:class I SAM-dependent methyltransferase [Oligoflexus tunisiensis]
MDPVQINKQAWDHQVSIGNPWTIPVTPEDVAQARLGNVNMVLTPQKPIPRDWYPNWKGSRILALAAGGGQQGPLMAAAGADVTVFDNSPQQLNRDREVAAREGLALKTVEGDMADLSVFEDASFDFILHPCSNVFVPDVNPVWREAFRVLKRGGTLLAGFCNPVLFTMDFEKEKEGVAQMRYSIPYSDLSSLTAEERSRYLPQGEPLAFGHSLDDQIGGQLRAGFFLTGFYEDGWDADKAPVHRFLKCFIATRAYKP